MIAGMKYPAYSGAAPGGSCPEMRFYFEQIAMLQDSVDDVGILD
jgi:hypothetical protein